MEILFSKTSWFEIEGHVRSQLKQEVDAWNANRLLSISVDDLCKDFVDKYRIDIPFLDRNPDKILKEQEETQIDVSKDPMCAIYDRSQPVYVPGVRIEIIVPFTGNAAAFSYQPTTYTLNPPRASISNSGKHLILVITGTNLEVDAVLQEINSTLDKIDDYLTTLREDARKLNDQLDSIARQCIEKRRTDLQKNQKLLESLPFKLKQRDDSLRTHEVPQERRTIKLKPVQANSHSYQSLDETDYEHILKVIGNMAQVMEYSPDAFVKMREEVLRWHFLVQLNGHYEGQATGETFNYKGKTDILIKSEGKNIFIAECKYWSGPKKLTETIDQLLGYTSWRDTKVAIIVFNKNKNFTKVLEAIRSKTRKHPNCKRELDQRSETSFRFTFSHRDDPNREMTLTVMAFNVLK